MSPRQDCVHLVIGAVTYYVVFPIYYTHSILSAGWLAYRLASSTRSRQRNETNRSSPAQAAHENLQSHLFEMEQQKQNGWPVRPNYENEILFPIEVVSARPSTDAMDPAERISVLLQYYCEPSHSVRNSKNLAVPWHGKGHSRNNSTQSNLSIPWHGRGHTDNHSALSNLSASFTIAS